MSCLRSLRQTIPPASVDCHFSTYVFSYGNFSVDFGVGFPFNFFFTRGSVFAGDDGQSFNLQLFLEKCTALTLVFLRRLSPGEVYSVDGDVQFP